MEASGWTPTCERYATSWTPGIGSPEPEILLSSLFPGISRRRDASEAEDAGYGMFALYQTAVDTFRGTLDISSGRSSLTMDRPRSGSPYRVRLNTHSGSLRLSGDIVTVRIPVNDA